MTAYESVKCPDCGGEMISRTGKFGVFWGCKDYPRCKGTRDSEGRSKADREKYKEEQLESNDRDEMTAKDRFKFNRRKYD
jgi:ssDNA-binding Zn-finger/Zn-ribbon topoisomerase 1